MTRATAIGRRNGESGPVLILAVVAMILIVIAALLLFDIQTVIRGKVKAQNAVDAAALTAAEWQKHSLNAIGELNLYRATGALLSDPFFRVGVLNNPNTNDGELYGELENASQKIDLANGNFARFPNAGEFFDDDGKFMVERYEEFTDELIRIEKERRFLMATDKLISQMQTRLAFAGPLIGFGAAQKAAEYNGLRKDTDATRNLGIYRDIVSQKAYGLWNDSDYYNDDAFGYFWGFPYISMLNSVQEAGLYVGTKFTFAGMPQLVSDSSDMLTTYLGNSQTYQDILHKNWINLRPLLEHDFSDNWWSDLHREDRADYTYQSDLIPLHIEFSTSRYPYDEAAEIKAFGKYDRWKQGYIGDYFNDEDPVEYNVEVIPGEPQINEATRERHYSVTYQVGPLTDDEGNPVEPYFTYNDEDADMRYDVLPTLTWALFDPEWKTYSSSKRETWENDMLGRRFKDGADYQAGARAYFSASQDTSTALLTGSMGQKNRKRNDPNVADAFTQTVARYDAQQVSDQLKRLENSRFLQKIQTDALAKPTGVLTLDDGKSTRLPPFEAGRMVLPVFDDTALIPVSLEPVEGSALSNLSWMYYLMDFVPELSGSPTINDAMGRAVEEHHDRWGDYMPYYLALLMLSDPGFRQEGLDWLDKHKEAYEPGNGNGHATPVYHADDSGNEFKLH